MIQPSEDRRARRSRKLLKQGLLELLREKKFSEISVRDITERMDLNRGTFYLHYPDTTALLQSLETDMLQDAQAMIDQYLPTVEDSLQPMFEPLLDYVVEHREACFLLFSSDAADNLVNRMHDLIRDNGEPLLRRQFPQASESRMELLISFMTYGLIGLMKSWFDTGMAMSKPELVQAADRLLSGAAAGVLAQGDSGKPS